MCVCGGLKSDFFLGMGAAVRCLQGGGGGCRQVFSSILPCVCRPKLTSGRVLRSDLAGAPAMEFEEAPKAQLHPTMKLYGTGEAVVTEAFWEHPRTLPDLQPPPDRTFRCTSWLLVSTAMCTIICTSHHPPRCPRFLCSRPLQAHPATPPHTHQRGWQRFATVGTRQHTG